jgi:tRNA(Ile)-lysidine synthase
LKTLVAKVARQRLFSKGETVVVAVSGGADSVALLDILTHLHEDRLQLVVAHLNHGLRGAASDGDEAFVSGLAASYGLPFAVRRVDIADLAKSSRLSLEDAGRSARYVFLAETAKAHGATSIAVAHHLDDQAETVMIRLLRGAGGSGLSAMAASSSQGILKRPLLQVSRADIEQYLKLRDLTYRTDSTNADTTILRNSIRHELIPFLRKYNPKISDRLAATAEILACDEELLEQLTETAFTRLLLPEKTAIQFDIEALAQELRGLRLRLYRRALLELRGDLKHIALTHLEAIDRLIASGRPNARLKLPGNCFVSRSYGRLSFEAVEEPADPAWELAIAGEGSYLLPTGTRLLVERVARPVVLDPGSRRVAYLNPDAAPFPWLLRSFAPGDRFTPLGMTGAQKVKDFFVNEKLPLKERRNIPLLECKGQILWVVGLRMAEQGRLTAATGAALRVEILDITP